MLQDNKGMSLIEVLVALVLIAVASLALMQMSLVSMRENVKNAMRDEGVRIAEEDMNAVRNTNFTDASLFAGPYVMPAISRNVRNSNITFNLSRTITNLDSAVEASVTNKRVDVTVTWTWKGQPYTHAIAGIVRRQ